MNNPASREEFEKWFAGYPANRRHVSWDVWQAAYSAGKASGDAPKMQGYTFEEERAYLKGYSAGQDAGIKLAAETDWAASAAPEGREPDDVPLAGEHVRMSLPTFGAILQENKLLRDKLASAAEREKRLGKALLRIQHLIGQFLFKSSRKAQLRIMNEIVQESERALSEVSAEHK